MADGVNEQEREGVAREGEHVPPTFMSQGFHCDWCGVLAGQQWTQLYIRGSQGVSMPSSMWLVQCQNCRGISYWLAVTQPGAECVYPVVGGGPRPHREMPVAVRDDYEEARAIVQQSPRGACALLRLATQRLVDELEAGGSNLNTKIGKMVENGLAPQAQQALDALRVIGNEAVHPGDLDLRDDVETATGLFLLLNFIVDDQIDRPKRIGEMYAKLPAAKLQAIQQRDGAAGKGRAAREQE